MSTETGEAHEECGREVSDKAAACPGCGAPIGKPAVAAAPTRVRWNEQYEVFKGTMPLMVKLAMSAVQALGWKIDQVNENLGLVTFQTGMTWGSFSGVGLADH